MEGKVRFSPSQRYRHTLGAGKISSFFSTYSTIYLTAEVEPTLTLRLHSSYKLPGATPTAIAQFRAGVRCTRVRVTFTPHYTQWTFARLHKTPVSFLSVDEIPLSDWAATLGNPGILGLPIRYNSAGIVVSMLDGLSKLVKQGELTVASTKSARARDAVAATCLLSGVQHSVNNLERQERVGKVVNFFVIIPVYNFRWMATLL